MTASGRKADSTVHLSKAAIEKRSSPAKPHNGRAATVALGLASRAPSKITLELSDPAGRIQPQQKCSDSPASHKARLGTRCFESSENIGSTCPNAVPGTGHGTSLKKMPKRLSWRIEGVLPSRRNLSCCDKRLVAPDASLRVIKAESRPSRRLALSVLALEQGFWFPPLRRSSGEH